MRRCILTACLLAFMLTGCATHSTPLVPPGTDRDELVAAIARKGQDTSSDGLTPTPEFSVVASCANGTVLVVQVVAYVAGQILYGVAQAGGHH